LSVPPGTVGGGERMSSSHQARELVSGIHLRSVEDWTRLVVATVFVGALVVTLTTCFIVIYHAQHEYQEIVDKSQSDLMREWVEDVQTAIMEVAGTDGQLTPDGPEVCDSERVGNLLDSLVAENATRQVLQFKPGREREVLHCVKPASTPSGCRDVEMCTGTGRECSLTDPNGRCIFHKIGTIGEPLWLQMNYKYSVWMGGLYSWSFVALFVGVVLLLVSLSLLHFLSRAISAPIGNMIRALDSLKYGRFEDARRHVLNHQPKIKDMSQLQADLVSTIDSLEKGLEQAQRNMEYKVQWENAIMRVHDLKRPLTRTKALMEDFERGVFHRKPALLFAEIQRIDSVIKTVNATLHVCIQNSKQVFRVSEVDIRSLLKKAEELSWNPKASQTVRVELALHSSRMVRVDLSLFGSALACVIENALHAIEQTGGMVWIESHDDEFEGKPSVRLSISNSGPRIDVDVGKNLFKPLYTTGKEGGSGVGLWSSRVMLRRLHGDLDYDSGAERTTFVFQIPAGGEEDTSANSTDPQRLFCQAFDATVPDREAYDNAVRALINEFTRQRASVGRPLALLLIDDEHEFNDRILTLIDRVESLRDGIEVTLAPSLVEAEAVLLEKHVDCAICDVALSENGQEGYQLVAHIAETWPSVRCIIHSLHRNMQGDASVRPLPCFFGFADKPIPELQLLSFLTGGRIEEESDTVESTEMPARDLEEEAARPGPAGGPSALVVDDHPDLCDIQVVRLRRIGFGKVKTAFSVTEALASLADEPVDVVFADVELGDGEPDGFDLLRAIRGLPGVQPRFIFVSGAFEGEFWPVAQELGADGFLDRVDATGGRLRPTLESLGVLTRQEEEPA
jgi:signal transduction histidine kinase/DNA-binding NarL/FixJ family response regulator